MREQHSIVLKKVFANREISTQCGSLNTVSYRRGEHQKQGTVTILKYAMKDETLYSTYALDRKIVTGRF